MQDEISKEQSILNLLISERAKIQKSLDNIMIAIEEGIITSTTKARMNELENAFSEINMKIAAEESKLDRTLKKEDVEKFIIDALASEPKAMIELLIDKIIIYEDRIEIFYIYRNTASASRCGIRTPCATHYFFKAANKKTRKWVRVCAPMCI